MFVYWMVLVKRVILSWSSVGLNNPPHAYTASLWSVTAASTELVVSKRRMKPFGATYRQAQVTVQSWQWLQLESRRRQQFRAGSGCNSQTGAGNSSELAVAATHKQAQATVQSRQWLQLTSRRRQQFRAGVDSPTKGFI